MAKKSIESLYDVLFNMRKIMEDLVQNATGLVNDVNDYGGELNRVVKEQMQKYYIPAIQNLTKDENTPGSIIGIIRFMDSLPLAMTRVEPQVEQVAPVEQPNANIDMPVQSSATPEEAIPLNTSYENPIPGAAPEAPATPVEQPMAESKKSWRDPFESYEELEKYCAECLDDWGEPGQGPSDSRFVTFARKVLIACSLKDKDMLKKLAYDYADQRLVNPVYEELMNFLRDGLKESCDSEKIKESEEACPVCGKDPCECKPEEIQEAKKSTDICFGTALAKKKDQLNKITNNSDLIAFVKSVCEPLANDAEQEAYLNNMITTIKRSAFSRALMFVYNIILKGEGQGVIKESIVKYSVTRKSNMSSPLGEDLANLEDQEVALFNTEEEANERCDLLNKGVLPEEKDLFGTEYVVEKKEICEEC